MPASTRNRKVSKHPFSKWLYEALLAKDLTLDETATATGLSRSGLSELISNDTPNPTIDSLVRLSVALGVTLRTLTEKFTPKETA